MSYGHLRGSLNRDHSAFSFGSLAGLTQAAHAETSQPVQVVFIEGNVPGARALARGVAPGVVAVILDPRQDGVQQMADFLARSGLTNLAAIDILAHGSDGAMTLGTATLDAGAIASHQVALAQIGAALGQGAALQLYGCDVAEDAAGRAFIDSLSAAIGGSVVAAASHPVGAASQGGSWVLDAATGLDSAADPFTATTEASYQAILASPSLTSLYSFTTTASTSRAPYASLFMDANGNLIGTNTTSNGGGSTVFELTKSSSYTAAPVYFGGALPSFGAVIADPSGNLYGATYNGGSNGAGAVFEIVNTGGSYAASAPLLYSFATSGLYSPRGAVYRDASGNLLGTAYSGGTASDGGVWELVRNSGSYSYRSLFSFTGLGGAAPGAIVNSSLVADSSGNLFGATAAGGTGATAYGEVYEIPYNAGAYAAAPSIIYSFTNGSVNGGPQFGKLAIDAAGDLFGATVNGGTYGDGTIFELVNSGGGYTYNELYTVPNVTGGNEPIGSLMLDGVGNLFGVFQRTGTSTTSGDVFELPYTAGTGYAASPTILAAFTGTSGILGAVPSSGPISGGDGILLGTTKSGGGSGTGYGTVYEITGAGNIACYAAGTHIATPHGETMIEALRIGDAVLTADGEARAIIWLGRRGVDCTRQPDPGQTWPVRIAAGAFADGLPLRDLCVSPDHAMLIDGFLVPARALVNGATITQPPVAHVTYWHLELASHDAVLAEGLAAETYLDTGNRNAFENAGNCLVLHPRFGRAVHTALACAPFAADGWVVGHARARLAARAASLGFVLAQGAWHVEADGAVLAMANGSVTVPASAQDVRIVSGSARPIDTMPGSTDTRCLGVCLGAISIDGVALALDEAGLGGCHEVETDGVASWRWTDGNARLPARLWATAPARLSVTVTAATRVWRRAA